MDVELGVRRDVAPHADGTAHDDDLRDRVSNVRAIVQRGGDVRQRADCDDGYFPRETQRCVRARNSTAFIRCGFSVESGREMPSPSEP